ncbi:MAG: hypothetical protein U0166_27865 [Acidobacteriota bacterium]
MIGDLLAARIRKQGSRRGTAHGGDVPRGTARPRRRHGAHPPVGASTVITATNVCSAAARLGYALWSGGDRPSPDHANAKLILLLSSHLETGHYFNLGIAQRIIEGKASGAKIVTVDVRLSNTASMSDCGPHPPRHGGGAPPDSPTSSSPRVRVPRLHAPLGELETLAALRPDAPTTFDVRRASPASLARATRPRWWPAERGVDAALVTTIGRAIGLGARGVRVARLAQRRVGKQGGWQVARCLNFLSVLAGSVATRGGTSLASSHKYVPERYGQASPRCRTSGASSSSARVAASSHHELSFLLPTS